MKTNKITVDYVFIGSKPHVTTKGILQHLSNNNITIAFNSVEDRHIVFGLLTETKGVLIHEVKTISSVDFTDEIEKFINSPNTINNPVAITLLSKYREQYINCKLIHLYYRWLVENYDVSLELNLVNEVIDEQ